jgi:hypothetical protein
MGAMTDKFSVFIASPGTIIPGGFETRVIEALCAVLDGSATSDHCTVEYGTRFGSARSVRFRFQVEWPDELFERVGTALVALAGRKR